MRWGNVAKAGHPFPGWNRPPKHPDDSRRGKHVQRHQREFDRRSAGSHGFVVAEEAPLQRFPHGLRARVYVQPLVDLAHMGSYCVQTDIQRGGAGFIAVALGEHSENLQLPHRELHLLLLWGRGFLKHQYHLARDSWRHGGAAVIEFPNAFEEPGGRSLLEEITASAGAHGAEHRVAVLMDGKHQDGQFRREFMNPANALNTGHAGKPDISEQNVGRAAANLLERVLHRAVLTANLESR